MAQKHLQLLRNGNAYNNYEAALTALKGMTGYADGTPILARYTDGEANQKTLLGVVNTSTSTIDIINNVSDYLLRHYAAHTGDTTITTGDTIDEAIAKLVKKIDDSGAAATTKVVEGTDAGNNMTIASATSQDDGSTTYTINLSDVASASGLDAEISARKAVDGQNGDTYVANSGKKYISGATSLNDADVKLDAALAALETKSGFHIVEEAGTGTVLKQYKLLDGNNNQSGDTIVIYKDSSLVSMELVEVTGETGNTQVLRYTYIDASGATRTTDLNVSLLLSEHEFKSGTTVTSAGIVRGVVDPTSESFLTVGADGFKLSGVQTAIDTAVGTAVSGLDYSDTAVAGQYVSEVDETDGVISVSRADVSSAVLNNYSKGSNDSAVSATDTVNQAISKLENQIDKAKAASTTEVKEGTDTGNNMSISAGTAADGHKIYQINLTDVASASALAQEIQDRGDADDALDDRIDELSGKTFTAVAMTGGTANTAATADGTVQLNINTDGGKINLTGYQKGTDSSDVAATDTVNQAISKLENKADASKTVVVDGDNGGHVTVASSEASDGHMVYTINENDIASATALTQEISDREAGDNALDARLGNGVTSANTATAQLTALSGNSTSDTSATTSVEGAKKYADAKVGELSTIINNMDFEEELYDGTSKEFATYIKQENGVITEFSGRTISASDVTNVSNKAAISASSTVQAALDALADESAAITIKNTDGSINVTTGASGTDINVNIKTGEHVIKKDGNAGIYTDLDLIKITGATLPATVKERYQLLATDDSQIGVNIDIVKDSHIVSINYITTGEHAQNLEYVYIDASGNTQTTYVDMSQLVLETEFASGVTVTNHIAHGVVDPTSEKDSNNDSFLTVGADGFKVDGIKDEIDAKINALDVTNDTAVAGQYVAAIEEADGIVAVKSRANVSEAVLNNYQKGTASTEVLATDTINQAIGKLENQIDAAKAAATTRVVEGTDDGNNMTITSATSLVDGSIRYTINLTDVASASALTEEIAHRKAIDGVDGNAYTPDYRAHYINDARSLYSADQELDTAVYELSGKSLTGITVNNVTGTVANNVATVDIGGGDIKLSGYTQGSDASAPATGDTVNAAIAKLYNKGVQDHVVQGSATTVTTASTGTTVDVKLDTTSNINEYDATHAQAVDDTSKNVLEITANGLYLNNNWDCGIY